MIPLGVIQTNRPSTYLVEITTTLYDVNLRALFESLHGPAQLGDDITFHITNTGITSSTSAGIPSCRTGAWLGGVVPTLIHDGYIEPRGGNGGPGSSPNGQNGGIGFLIESPIIFDASGGGETAGGGGGGGGANGPVGEDYPEAGGGGGAPFGAPGASYDYSDGPTQVFAQSGTATTGGNGASVQRFISGSEPSTHTAVGGNGGARAAAGSTGSVGGAGAIIGIPGSAGPAISGIGLATVIDLGTVIGAVI